MPIALRKNYNCINYSFSKERLYFILRITYRNDNSKSKIAINAIFPKIAIYAILGN